MNPCNNIDRHRHRWRWAGVAARENVEVERFDWTTPELLDLQILFLRAARVVDDRSLDLPMRLRGLIASKLEKSGVPALQTAKIKGFVPIGRSDRASLYDESLPPGLILIE